MNNLRFKYRYFSILFMLSGFAGIVYESVWVHYIKIIVGHAAFAQTFILIIFLGGLSVGAWLGANMLRRSKKLFLLYAIAEALIGVLALFFHPLFDLATGFLLVNVYSNLPNLLAETIKWSFIVLLTLPPTVLMGATFPVLTAAFQRKFPDKKGRIVSQFYFVNSLGASAGILVCAFILIPDLGLPGSLVFAGTLNLLIAVFAFLIPENSIGKDKAQDQRIHSKTIHTTRIIKYLYVAALITGASSFVYQIVWIRMLSMVLGSSVQSFELMLSAFILGLALGAFIIKSKIDRFAKGENVFVIVQLLMGTFAIVSLLVYNNTFRIMEWLLGVIQRDQEGYLIFNISSHVIAYLVMLPATICAGIILPLIIKMIQQNGHGEEAIGKVYALDTAGGIIGIVAAVYILMPQFGLKFLLVIAGVIDILIGLGLLFITGQKFTTNLKALIFVSLSIVFGIIIFVHPDPVKMASGVFRYGNIEKENNILFQKDGKTATIAVFETPNGNVVLSTNGKPDASVNVFERVSGDEATQLLLAALPMSLRYDAKNVAVIGLGCGKTAHTALMNVQVDHLDVIEIESAVVEASKYFRPYVYNIFTDHRYDLHIADARNFFSKSKDTYDLIISEPSNPWVSGMASLFTYEFYETVASKLNDEGLFVQWIHTYEMSLPLVASIVKAFSSHFADYQLYFLDDGDVALIGKKTGILTLPGNEIFNNPEMNAELSRLGIESKYDLWTRFIGNKHVLNPFFFSYTNPANSDYFPILEYDAPRVRFLGSSAGELIDLISFPAPVLRSMWNSELIPPDSIGLDYTFEYAAKFRNALEIYKFFKSDNIHENPNYGAMDVLNKLVLRNIRAIRKPDFEATSTDLWSPYVRMLARATVPFLNENQLDVIWNSIIESSGWSQLPENAQIAIQLYQAAGQLDYTKILMLTDHLQKHFPETISPEIEYQFTISLWALLMTGQNDEALELWNKYKQPENISPLLRVLGALAEADWKPGMRI